MAHWTQVAYEYDGSFAGFLTCVFEAYTHREAPACFQGPEEGQAALWPARAVETDPAHAKRVYRSLARKLGRGGQELVARGFLTCLPQRELALWQLIQLGYERGPAALRDLTDSRVSVVTKAVQHLNGEAHLLKGFLRFSELDGVLVGEIEPKNRVLPLLRRHFCARYSGECFVIHDRTHREALFYRPGQWSIVPVEDFRPGAPGERERAYRTLWRRFYDTIAIAERYNPKCRMTQMPKRYWNTMTEFLPEEPPELPETNSPSAG